jgi:phosphopantothenoylcysteine decarboxylase/phosphopantothenate--cysteine ligase
MNNAILKDKRIIITAGPTREAIDPVRFISNHSTGKMGYAIAEYLYAAGADVHVISGPVQLKTSLPDNVITNVTTADEMLATAQDLSVNADAVIFSAAVSDYKTLHISTQKMKKQEGVLQLSLVPNPDIAYELSKNKREDQVFVGFALETENGLLNAISKLQRKRFDFIVLNIQDDSGSGFGYNTNRIKIIDSNLQAVDYPLKLKSLLAADIVYHLIEKFQRYQKN